MKKNVQFSKKIERKKKKKNWSKKKYEVRDSVASQRKFPRFALMNKIYDSPLERETET